LRWTDYYWRYEFLPHQELQDFVDLMLEPEKPYFTVLQSFHGIQQELPNDVLVFAAGGPGGVPIPLIRKDLEYSFEPSKEYKVTFQGDFGTTRKRTVDVRRLMHEKLAGRKDFHFLNPDSPENYYTALAKSEFVLCPRGAGPTSFRLHESLSLGAIPIYIWEDVEWLPYREELDWSQLIVSINYRHIDELPGIIEAMPPDEIALKQKYIREHHKEYFSLNGVCRYILRSLDQEEHRR